MRVLFDQGTPVPLRRHLIEHQVSTAFKLRWASIQSGQLLQQAEVCGFEVLITTDQNLKSQQNLSEPVIGIVVLGSTS